MRLVIALCLFTGVARAACTSVDQTHAQWSAILAQWVTDGRVDYAGLQRDGQPALAAYLADVSGACAPDYERWTRAERIAFWINAYNAFTVRLILDHYPRRCVMQRGSPGTPQDGYESKREDGQQMGRSSHACMGRASNEGRNKNQRYMRYCGRTRLGSARFGCLQVARPPRVR